MEKLFSGDHIDIDHDKEGGVYRITLFNDGNHWDGEIYYNPINRTLVDEDGNNLRMGTHDE